MSELLAIHQQHHAEMTIRNGISVPLHYGSVEQAYQAVRENILLVDYSHFGIAEVKGESAWELLNQLVSGDVSSIRDEQAMYTLILDEKGEILTDLYVACDDERFLLISEWLTGDKLCALLRDEQTNNADAFPDIEHIASLSPAYGTLHLEGPFCWELLAEIYGMDVIGLPFQEHMRIDEDLILLRTGKHGEFSYKLIGKREQLAQVWETLYSAGQKYDLRAGGLAYQNQVRLENPCFDPHLLASLTRCPIALQMQWAIRYDKPEFRGSKALFAKQQIGIKQKLVGFTASLPDSDLNLGNKIEAGAAIKIGNKVIGTVANVGVYSALNQIIGRALIDEEYAYADIEGYELLLSSETINSSEIVNSNETVNSSQTLSIKTSPVPFAKNYSFLINPSEHSYIDETRPRDLIQQAQWQQAQTDASARNDHAS